MELPTAVYTAYNGYSWSNIPENMSMQKLNQLHQWISCARGDFPDPMSVEVGLVSDGEMAAAFTIQNVDHWDSAARACDYAAFAFFPIVEAADIDFIELINHDFFWTPTRDPEATLEYSGSGSAPAGLTAKYELQEYHQHLLRNPRSLGAIIALHGHRSSRWVCLMKAENILKIECDKWN